MIRLIWVSTLAAWLALAPAAGARTVLLRPGPEGEDVVPYSFLPSARRFNNETQWAFHATDPGTGFDHAMETFLRFSLPPDLLAPGEAIAQAVFWIYYVPLPLPPVAGSPSAGPAELWCHEVTASWSETTLTWNNKPRYEPEPFDGRAAVENYGLIWCNVTGLVRDWFSGARPNYGIALTNSKPHAISFYSFEAPPSQVDPNFRPSLAIEITASLEADFDGDGVFDLFDNCVRHDNVEQQDSDQDGFGNVCDADFNDDGVVGAGDVALIASRAGVLAAGNEEFDLDSSGVVGANDVARAANASGQPPGPSGLACAGVAPCP